MIIIVDNRYEVGAAYAAAFDREGVAASVFKFAEVLDWFEGLSEAEISVISGFMIGMSDDRLRVLRGIRQKTKLPVIALSERRSLDETLELFGGGVDDVVAKPVHVRELLMRLHVIKSREIASGRVLDLPDLVIFSDGRDALVAGTALALPRREKRILDCLADARGGWVTKSQMFHRVYGLFNEDIDENVIESHISRLRKRMRLRLGREVIESQRYLGYRLALANRGSGEVTASPMQGGRAKLDSVETGFKGAVDEHLRYHENQYVGDECAS